MAIPQETINIVYEPTTNRMMLQAPMQNQEAKDHTVRMLLQAIKIVLDFQQPVIQPAKAMPSANGNGKIFH